MSSSESEDEELNKLRAAVDTNFLSDSFYKENQNEDKPKPMNKVLENKPSLRRKRGEDDEELNPLRLTEGIQQHVASKLSDFLDKQLEDCLDDNVTDAVTPTTKVKGRVKLLKSSTKYLKVSHKSDNDDNAKDAKFGEGFV